ncbi:MAG: 2-alkenal reductase [Chloroflexi bacterium]|nr:MAG: 2-alkenal reductase [Chloroflexota bacterium]
MKKTISTLTILILSMFVLAGCSGTLVENLPIADAVAETVAETTETVAETAAEAVEVVPVTAQMDPPAQDKSAPANSTTSINLAEAQDTLTALYETVNPAVVNIQVKISADAAMGQFGGFKLPEDFEWPEGMDPHNMDPDNLPEGFNYGYSQGSGFVYDSHGHIITNHHVVSDAEKITVIFANGIELEAELVGTDPDSDLAVIKIDPSQVALTTVPLGDSDQLKVGQFVVAIGNPFGLSGSMTSGIISGLGRTLPANAAAPNGRFFSIPDIIQTDTAINPGNSGGPLLNLDGQVVGVNTAIATNDGEFAGVGYVIPVETVHKIVPQLIANGEVQNPWIGISGQEMNKTLAEAMNIDPNQKGIMIAEIIADGPAAQTDLRGSEQEITIDGFPALVGGDIIVGIDNLAVEQFDDLLSYIVQETEVGQTVTLTILRNGKQIQIDVTLEARPSE